MAFDIAIKTEVFAGNEDRRWMGLRKGADTCRSVTLDVSAFLPAHFTDKGAIPSGTIIGRITATGKYGPYDNAAIDGRETAAGFLFNTTVVGQTNGGDIATAADIGVPMLWEGLIKTAFLPLFAGTVVGELDAAARTDLGNFIRFEDA